MFYDLWWYIYIFFFKEDELGKPTWFVEVQCEKINEGSFYDH